MQASNKAQAGRYRSLGAGAVRRLADVKNIRRLFEAFGIVGSLLLLFFIGAGGYIGGVWYFSRTPAAAPADPKEAPSASGIERHRLGSILFVPWTGADTCEERHFDNLTGRISPNGTVVCEFARPTENGSMQLRLSDEPVIDARARFRAIHETFKK